MSDSGGLMMEEGPRRRKKGRPAPLCIPSHSEDGPSSWRVGTSEESEEEEGGERSQEEKRDEETRRKISRVTLSDELTVIVDDEDVTETERDAREDSSPGPWKEEEEMVVPTLGEYFWGEITRGYSLQNDESRYSEKRKKVYAFLQIPWEVEQFLLYGLLQCIDAFAYLFTFLPIRFVMSLLGFVTRQRRWTATETCDLLKVGIIVSCSCIMQFVDTSMVYHMVRSQAVIKLYMFYNMLEVGDKLFSSLGQDILESLFWTASESRSIKSFARTALHFLFAVILMLIHTIVVLLQATVLNVAFNSHNEALLAIMMSNNFVELKGSVFKKFAKANLFQMACSDVRERFHTMTLLFVVVIRNMKAVNWNVDHLFAMAPNLILIIGCEFVVDWLKHAFITKFNEINVKVYRDFTITIAFDVVRSREESAYSDYSDQVSRRMGFIPIPLSIMLIRVIAQTFSFNTPSSVALALLMWLILISIKVCNGLIMLGQACAHVLHYRQLQESARQELARRRLVEKKCKSAPSSPTAIALVDFTDVLHQPQGPKGMTVSDWLGQQITVGEEKQTAPARVGESSEGRKSEERTPRRSLSLVNIARERRDKSEPPPVIPEEKNEEETPAVDRSEEEKKEKERKEEKDNGQLSPKKKPLPSVSSSTQPTGPSSEAEQLSDVTAYTMLSPDRGVERIE
ncbi:hypothetical protein PFISCL1PPCAC_543 [Pristionchus fissidentatus]|uniref:Uncharacterized protein n=1 Tax=Pristionchus fissidentatus TaxID=1538716 RepID=A0AAV5US07_9BILA|nr:hypothetical protein PFISCL1PPCAC_543 [Pristionchus fissidentatus]